ncbi:hypothetical protein PS15m_004103 [Mucor circinelloides]
MFGKLLYCSPSITKTFTGKTRGSGFLSGMSSYLFFPSMVVNSVQAFFTTQKGTRETIAPPSIRNSSVQAQMINIDIHSIRFGPLCITRFRGKSQKGCPFTPDFTEML